ncbi:unnamed protein product [Caenorhabditis sp. 36 PRJEB53466]|nr:unnamed protein product [Caenorhabditis sp. 36 PRJEB53466]
MMNLRFAATILLVGLLLVSSIEAWKKKGKESSDDGTASPTVSEAVSSTTGAAGSSGTSVTSVSSTTTPAGSAGTSNTPDPSASTPSAATLPSGATTEPQPTGGSTGTTGTPGSTTPAPLPDVTVSLLQFAAPVCSDTVCTYQFAAPGNDQSFLATESSAIADDRTQYVSLQSAADAKDTNIKKASDAAHAKIRALQTLLDNIQSNLDSIHSNIAVIQASQLDAQSTLQFVEKFVSDVNSAPSNCLYQKCLKPTTPAPPTTTPTPVPTTPPSPCLNFTCPGDETGGACLLDNTNQPYCTNCVDNFNGYSHCDSVACSAAGTNFTVNATSSQGVLYSSGYNQTVPASSLVPANSDCRWQLSGSFSVDTTTAADFNLTCLSSTNVVMYLISSDGFSQKLVSTTTARSLTSALSKFTNPIFTLTSTAADASFCSIPLKLTSSGSGAQEEPKEKKNGFFSWLMGY